MERINTIEEFGETEQLAITVLVDNKADLIVKSTETIKYFEDGPLLAEHGFSVLFHLGNADFSILWDAGISQVALIENLRRMKIDPTSINKIALSHGHFDHFGALTDLLAQMDLHPDAKYWDESVTAEDIDSWIKKHRIPLIAHPAAFRERWRTKEDGTKVGPFIPPPRQEWEAKGASIILSKEPYQLEEGCWTTGYIPRQSFEKSGRPKEALYRQRDIFFADNLEEDQAIVINIKEKGLVILSGCAHSGIVNTVNYAKEISGVDNGWAIIGGFHLARATDKEIQQTIDHIKTMEPNLIVPCHCTGFRAQCQFARQMPDVFEEGVVGATYLF